MSKHEIDRRDFARRVALGLAPLTVAAVASAADEKKEPPLVEPADHLLAMLVAEYPENLTREHLVELRAKLSRQLARSKVLSSFPLTNADEPATILRAYRGAGK